MVFFAKIFFGHAPFLISHRFDPKKKVKTVIYACGQQGSYGEVQKEEFKTRLLHYLGYETQEGGGEFDTLGS